MIDLAPDHLSIVERILAEHVPECEVRAYGSRVTWTARAYSDLDLAVMSDRPLNQSVMGRLKEEFEDSSLPIRVDVLDWHSIPGRFQDEIDREYVVLQKGIRAPGWREVTLGQCARLIRQTVSPSPTGDSPYIGLQHIGEGSLSLLDYGIESDVKSAKLRFSRGDLLFGKLRPYFHKIVLAPFGGVCSTDIWVVRATEGIDQEFLFYRMASPSFVDFATLGSEGTRMPRAQWEHVSRYKFLLPPLEEQRTIARVLRTFDDKIELNRRMSETLEEMARALFKSWFVDFDPVRAKIEGRWRPGESLPGLPADLYDLFPDRLIDSKLGKVPDGWQVGTLEDVIEVNPRRKLRRGETAAHVAMAAMPTSGSHIAGWTRRPFTSGSRFVSGDTLLARITPSLENGKTALVDFLDEHETGWGSTELVVLRPKNPWPFAFAYLLARLPAFRRHAIVNMTGTSGRQRVPPKAIGSYCLAVAPKNVGVAFSKVIQSLFMSTTGINCQSRTLATMRNILLPKLVSGEVRVTISDKPATPVLTASSE